MLELYEPGGSNSWSTENNQKADWVFENSHRTPPPSGSEYLEAHDLLLQNLEQQFRAKLADNEKTESS